LATLHSLHLLKDQFPVRVSRFLQIVLLSLLTCFSSLSAADPQVLVAEKPAALHPFSILGKNLSDCFWGETTFFHLGAFATTSVMVNTHADRKIQDYFIEKNPLGQPFAFAMLRLGDATSIILGLSFWGIGSWVGDSTLAAAGAAAVQAVTINGAFVGSLKMITGRTRPGEFNRDDDFFPSWKDRVDDFGHRLSWPSGHTSSSFAFVASQHAFYPKEKWIPWVGYPITAAIGIGMVEGDYHWASEVIAGAIIGTVIGYTTGRNFREEYERRRSGKTDEPKSHGYKKPAFIFSPAVTNGGYAMSVTWYW